MKIVCLNCLFVSHKGEIVKINLADKETKITLIPQRYY